MKEKTKTLLYSILLFFISLAVFIIFPHIITLIALAFFSYGILYEIVDYIILHEKALESVKPKTEEEKNKRQKIFWYLMVFLFLFFLVLPFITDIKKLGFDYLVILFGFILLFVIGFLTKIYNKIKNQ